eukprot:GFUD01033746.1.p1 GENE.GFUD01033746.1~~GFUD01033746.1.p1  ORF type:complete len:215 (+),score=71.33 GFUD01033746.1:61-705(+)
MASSIIGSPKSPQVSRLRKDMYKKSPVRSPLRQVLKSRCQERIRTNRDKVVSGMRDIQVEGRELVENTIREMVRDEVAAWRGGRKCLSFGYSNEDIEDALNEVEEIENELFGELYGVDCNYEENLLALQKHVVCPMCQVDKLEDGAAGMVRCKGRQCGMELVCVGGLAVIQRELDMVVERHGEKCGEGVQFVKGENCLMVICSECDFCQALGGF